MPQRPEWFHTETDKGNSHSPSVLYELCLVKSLNEVLKRMHLTESGISLSWPRKILEH